jgi:hypothetical protein
MRADSGPIRILSVDDHPLLRQGIAALVNVMACNNSGVWNEAGASFYFSIDPAHYQTRWFQASCVAAFLGLLWRYTGTASIRSRSN